MKEVEEATFEVMVARKLTARDLVDILITAIESGRFGVRYWSPTVRLRTQDQGFTDPDDQDVVVAARREDEVWNEYICRNVVEGGTLTFFEDEDGTGEGNTPHVMTREKLLAGIGAAVTNPNVNLDDIDGAAADIIVQFALLGEIVYG